MFRKILFAAILGSTALTGARAGLAQEVQGNAQIVARLEAAAKQDPALATYLQSLARRASRGKDPAIRSALQMLFQIGPRGTVTAEDISRHEAKQKAQQRGRLIGSYLAWDLDGDGAISAAERDAFEGYGGTELALLFATGDENADGEIDPEELLAYAAGQTRVRSQPQNAGYLMLYDVDQNGEVTTDEVVATIDALAETEPQTNGEPAQRPFAFSPPGTRQAAPTCDAPAPSDKSDLVVLSGYEGAALSTTTIAGMDGVTHVGRIEIEPGDKPLYVFLAAHSNMIWEVTGETGRIAAFVVQRSRAGTTGAGVIGVAKDKVHFVDPMSCMDPVHNMTDAKTVLAYRRLAENIGRDPDVMVATYTIDTVALPSGEGSEAGADDEGRDIVIYGGRRYEFTPEGPRLLDESDGQRPGEKPFGAERVYREMLRFNPAGLRAIDPATVVAPDEAVAYDVMPQEAGLLQLLLEEKLRYSHDGYVVEQPIARFPAGLNGAHSVKFVLAEGVPMPKGSPGHSDVFSAETGECLEGPLCRR